jgi:hypothetical protein
MFLCLIQTLLFNLPQILQRRSWPSCQFTKIRSNPSIVTAMPRTSFATGNTIFSISSSLMIFFLPKDLPLILSIYKKKPTSKRWCYRHRRQRRLIQPIISTRLPSAWPGTPFLKRALTRPFFPCNATIFPMALCFLIGQATFRPMSRAAPPTDPMPGKRRIYSFGFWVLGPLRQLTMTPSTVLDIAFTSHLGDRL